MRYENLERVQDICKEIRENKEFLESISNDGIQVCIQQKNHYTVAIYQPYLEGGWIPEKAAADTFIATIKELTAKKISHLESELETL